MVKLVLNRKLAKNLLYSLIVFSLAYLFGMPIGIKLNIFSQLLMVTLISTLVSFFILNPLSIYFLIFLTFISTIIVSRFFPSCMKVFIEKTTHLFSNIYYHIRDLKVIAPENRLPFWGILIILLSIYTGMIILKNRKTTFLLPLYIGGFLYYWYLYYDQAYWMMALFLFLFLILLGLERYFKEINGIKFKNNIDFEKLYNLWSKTTLKYGIIIVMLSLIIPKSSYSIHWPWLENRIESFFPGIINLRSTNTQSKKYIKAGLFDFSKTGFQKESSRLGGPVVLDNTLVMTIYGEGPFYLRGNIKHMYTGYSWVKVQNIKESFKLGEDFSKIPLEIKKRYFNSTSIKITYESFASQTLFSPYKGYIVNFEDNAHNIEVDYDGELFFPPGVYSKESYKLEVLTPLNYNSLIDLGIDEKRENLPNLSLYLQIPEDKITAETVELVKEIVKDKETDLEKALALEDYLRNNYNYNLEVKEVPINQEFIHHFLFESKEGYCTYFATALAIMLRIEGIPTRYVEGYLAHESIDKGIYQVKNSHAHAWVEAFIEPIGWMTLDPTPAYPPIDRTNTSPAIETETIERLPEDFDVLDKSLWVNLEISRGEINGDLKESKIQNNTSKNRWYKHIKNLPTILMSLILFAMTMRLITRYLKIRIKNARVKKLPNKERVIYLYDEIVRLAGLMGCSQESGETHYEYANRLHYNYNLFTAEKDIREITGIFVRNKYGNFPTTNEDVIELERYKDTIAARIKKHIGIKDYYYGIYFKRN